jgi:hypothetical protein
MMPRKKLVVAETEMGVVTSANEKSVGLGETENAASVRAS